MSADNEKDEKYRQLAVELRAAAEQMHRPELKRRTFELAQEYEREADRLSRTP